MLSSLEFVASMTSWRMTASVKECDVIKLAARAVPLIAEQK